MVADANAVSPFDHAADSLLADEINRLLAPLDEREATILRLRFGLGRGSPRTLEEVGRHFNLTRERIRQIEAKAMSKLRHPSVDNGGATCSTDSSLALLVGSVATVGTWTPARHGAG